MCQLYQADEERPNQLLEEAHHEKKKLFFPAAPPVANDRHNAKSVASEEESTSPLSRIPWYKQLRKKIPVNSGRGKNESLQLQKRCK